MVLKLPYLKCTYWPLHPLNCRIEVIGMATRWLRPHFSIIRQSVCNYAEDVDTWELYVLLNLDIALKNRHNATDSTVADERDIYGYRALPGRRGNRFEAFLLFKHCINAKVKQKHRIANFLSQFCSASQILFYTPSVQKWLSCFTFSWKLRLAWGINKFCLCNKIVFGVLYSSYRYEHLDSF